MARWAEEHAATISEGTRLAKEKGKERKLLAWFQRSFTAGGCALISIWDDAQRFQMEVNVIVDSTCACGEVVMHLTLSPSTRQRTKGAASPLDYMIEFKKLQPKVPL